ncbi:MAG: hypothetical protein WCF48_13450, partial [Terriglobales bacterium]
DSSRDMTLLVEMWYRQRGEVSTPSAPTPVAPLLRVFCARVGFSNIEPLGIFAGPVPRYDFTG